MLPHRETSAKATHDKSRVSPGFLRATTYLSFFPAISKPCRDFYHCLDFMGLETKAQRGTLPPNWATSHPHNVLVEEAVGLDDHWILGKEERKADSEVSMHQEGFLEEAGPFPNTDPLSESNANTQHCYHHYDRYDCPLLSRKPGSLVGVCEP